VFSIGIKVDLAKIEVISNILVPTQKNVISFLGHVGYYRWFIENFTKIVSPLLKLFTKDNEFFWNIPCQTTFETLKEKLFVAHVLRGTNWSFPFHISADASNIYLGAVLGQKENKLSYAIYFLSKNMTPPKLNYIVMEN